MFYNKAKEEKKWSTWKKKEEKKLRELGMEEKLIQLLRQEDWDRFNSDRRYQEHQAIFSAESALLTVEIEEPEINGTQPLLDNIGDEQLFHILRDTDRTTLKIISLKVMGFSIREIAYKTGISEKAVYCRISRLKKKIKKFKESEEKE